MAGTFVVQKAKNGQFFFNLKAENNETILTSETYTSKAGALKGIKSVKANARSLKHFVRKGAEGRKPSFVLRAANNRTIGASETYSSAEAMENGIAAVKRCAPGASVSDRT